MSADRVDPLLLTRGKKTELKPGDRVVISPRCGDGWGEGTKDGIGRGTVIAIEPELDEKGRHYVGVLADAFPTHDGKVKRNGDENPPLPRFEAGLLTKS